jgi:hypothetical protein
MTTDNTRVRNNPDNKYLDEKNPCQKGHTPTTRYKKSGRCIVCARIEQGSITYEKKKEYAARYKAKKDGERPSIYDLYKTVIKSQADWVEAQLSEIKINGKPIIDPDDLEQMHLMLQHALNYKLSYPRGRPRSGEVRSDENEKQ